LYEIKTHKHKKKNIAEKASNIPLKNNLVATAEGQITWLSETYPGSDHDKKIMDKEPVVLRNDLQDTGFQGHRPREASTGEKKEE
jgi:hypothetical protein